jgi:hypothetical protein
MPIRSDKIRQTTFKHAVETDFKRPQRFHKLVVKAIRKVAAQRVTDANGDQATEQKCRMAFDQLASREGNKRRMLKPRGLSVRLFLTIHL